MKSLISTVIAFSLLNFTCSSVFAAAPAPTPRTGQTAAYVVGLDDGALKPGVVWPTPRFTDNTTTVTDNLTGLIWVKNANLMKTRDPSFDGDGPAQDGAVSWQHALDYIKKLNTESYLGSNDWRLPNKNELWSLVDYGRFDPALPIGHLFTTVQLNYWSSSTTSTAAATEARYVFMSDGTVPSKSKTSPCFVWPVRAGQILSFGPLSISGNPDWGYQSVAIAARSRTITLTNRDATFHTLNQAAIAGVNAIDFTIANDTCSNQNIDAGAACTLEVLFSPSAGVSRIATFNIASEVAPAAVIPLTGTGVTDIRGVVTDLSTGLPLKDVTVTISGGGSVISINDGSFSFSPGYATYTLTLAKTGYSGYIVNNVSTSATAGATLKLGMAPPGLLNITTLPPLVPTSTFVDTIKATGGVGPYTYTLAYGTLPAGFILDTAQGTITGVPATASAHTFAIGVNDSLGAHAEREYTVSYPIIITAPSLLRATQGVAYSTAITTQSAYLLTFSATSLPPGLSLSATTGFISNLVGTPTTVGPYSFNVTVTDTVGRSYVRTFDLYVEGPLGIATTSLVQGVVGSPYQQILIGSGGFPPYTWSLDAGTLPAGLSLNALTGEISGIPTTVESRTVSITIHDYLNRTVSMPYPIDIAQPLALGANLPRGMQGIPYSTTLVATGGVTPYTFNITAGTLPSGFSLISSTGVISGPPTVAGSSPVTVTVTDAGSRTATANYTLYIDPALVITTATLKPGLVGADYKQPLTATGGVTPYVWSVTSGPLPAGLTLDSATGVISGISAVVARPQIIVMVTDAYGRSTTKPFTMDIATALVLDPTVRRGMQGSVYDSSLAVTGGTGPYTFAITVGTLLAGLTLNPVTGVISGTPTVTGCATVTVRVTDAMNRTDTKIILLYIDLPLSIITPTLAPWVVNVPAYSQRLTGAGGLPPYRWSVTSGVLPHGLILGIDTGIISGTPTSVTQPLLTITVIDADNRSFVKTYILDIANPLLLSPATLPRGMVGELYTMALPVSGGTPPYSLWQTSGTFPGGVILGSATGVLNGTPSTSGSFDYSVIVYDSFGRVSTATYTLVVDPAFAITTPTLKQVTAGAPYNQILTAVGGLPPYSWRTVCGMLTTGLTLGPITGIISGTPTTSLAQQVCIGVTDAIGRMVTRTYVPLLTLHTTTMPDGFLNEHSYSENLMVSGGIPPYTFALSGQLPAGLSLNTSNGLISGIPAVVGNTNATITITDSSSPTPLILSSTFSIRIWGMTTIVTSATLPRVLVNTPMTPVQLRTMAPAPAPYACTYSVIVGSLPSGLTLSPEGLISGTPTVPGNYTVTVLTAGAAGNAEKIFYITVVAQIRISTATVDTGSVGVSYRFTLQADAGAPPYSWNIVSGTLPAGLTLSATGLISGIPLAQGVSSVTIRVTDSDNPPLSTEQNLVIGIDTFTIATSAGSNGSITPGRPVDPGTNSLSITVTPNADYHIAAVWIDGISQTITDPTTFGFSFINVTSNHTMSATFAIDTSITTTPGQNGTITPSRTVTYGSDFTVSVTPNPNYHIATVLIDDVSQIIANQAAFSYTFTTVNAPHTVRATFAPDSYLLSVIKNGICAGTVSDVSGGAIFCGPVCSDSYPYGHSVQLYATHDPSCLFRWSGGGCTGDGSFCTVAITGAKNVTATFTAAPRVKINTIPYLNLQAAYDIALNNDVILMLVGIDDGTLAADRDIIVTVRGGYNAAYTAQAGSTVLQGMVNLQKGTVIFDRVTVR